MESAKRVRYPVGFMSHTATTSADANNTSINNASNTTSTSAALRMDPPTRTPGWSVPRPTSTSTNTNGTYTNSNTYSSAIGMMGASASPSQQPRSHTRATTSTTTSTSATAGNGMTTSTGPSTRASAAVLTASSSPMFAGDLSGILNSSAHSDDASGIHDDDHEEEEQEGEEDNEGDISMARQPGMRGPVTRSTSMNSSYSASVTPTASRYTNINDTSLNTSSSAVKRKRGASVIGSPGDWAGVLMNNASMFGDDLNDSSYYSNKRSNTSMSMSSSSGAADVSADLSQSALFDNNENVQNSMTPHRASNRTPLKSSKNGTTNGNTANNYNTKEHMEMNTSTSTTATRSSNFFQSPSRMVTRQRASAQAH